MAKIAKSKLDKVAVAGTITRPEGTPDTPSFQGDYVQDILEVLRASAIANLNCMLIGAPGIGKTRMAIQAARQIVGAKFLPFRLDESTPPEKVAGLPDPVKMVSEPPVFEINRVGTMFDPEVNILLADEAGRTHPVVYSVLLDAMDRLDLPEGKQAPVTWLTSNFIFPSERLAAVIDRVALWHYPKPGTLEVRNIVSAQLEALHYDGHLTLPGDFPTWAEIEDIRRARPTPASIATVQSQVAVLAERALNAGALSDADLRRRGQQDEEQAEAGTPRQNFVPNPRRLAQWSELLFYMGVWASGKADFNYLPVQATRVLRFAWPCTTWDMYQSWVQVAASVGDTIGIAIAEIQRKAADKYRELMAGYGNGEPDTIVISTAMGAAQQQYERELRKIGSGQSQVLIDQAIERLTQIFAEIVNGIDPFTGRPFEASE